MQWFQTIVFCRDFYKVRLSGRQTSLKNRHRPTKWDNHSKRSRTIRLFIRKRDRKYLPIFPSSLKRQQMLTTLRVQLVKAKRCKPSLRTSLDLQNSFLIKTLICQMKNHSDCSCKNRSQQIKPENQSQSKKIVQSNRKTKECRGNLLSSRGKAKMRTSRRTKDSLSNGRPRSPLSRSLKVKTRNDQSGSKEIWASHRYSPCHKVLNPSIRGTLLLMKKSGKTNLRQKQKLRVSHQSDANLQKNF